MSLADQWFYFLKNAEIKESFSAKGLVEANEKLTVLAMSDAERQVYEAFQYELHHRASEYEGTFVLGKMEGKGEVAPRSRDRLHGPIVYTKNDARILPRPECHHCRIRRTGKKAGYAKVRLSALPPLQCSKEIT